MEHFRGKNIGVSLNLSLADVTNEDIVDFILEQIKGFDNPSLVTFEILEDSSVTVIQKVSIASGKDRIVNKFFDGIKSHGCNIAIDNFGSGYSNFINILTLNPDIIKIDGTLIRNMHNEKIKLMTELFITYAKIIGCQVVAEFVEDIETQKLIEEMGIEYSQGYLIGKPNIELIK